MVLNVRASFSFALARADRMAVAPSVSIHPSLILCSTIGAFCCQLMGK